MTTIATCLWFDGKAEEAASFYVSLFPDSRIDSVMRSAVDTPGAKAGAALFVEFTLAGRPFQGLNGGPGHPFTQAISLSVGCADQAEVDRIWDALEDGGTPVQCGWITDRYGLSWQVVPEGFMAMMRDPDQAKARRAMEAMMGMVKLDLAALRRAVDGQD